MKYNDKNIELKIMENVSQLIYEKGVKGWNMDELSQKSGLAKNTLYRIITSKEDIICKVVFNHIKNAQAKLQKIMQTESDYIRAFEKIVEKFPRLMDTMYSEYIFEIINEYSQIESKIRASRNELTQSLIAFIQKGIKQKKIRQDVNPEFLVELLQSVIISYIRLGCKGKEMELKLSTAFDYIVNGIK